jgi:uncharacterized protein YodC (DUF2158 family)
MVFKHEWNGNRRSTYGSAYCIGDYVVLNSGGPTLLVVDFENGKVVCAQSDGTEHVFPQACVSRARLQST